MQEEQNYAQDQAGEIRLLSYLCCWARDVVYSVLFLLLLPYLLVRSLRTGRYREGIRQKLWGMRRGDLSSRNEADTSKPLVWLHGVSVGEVQLLAPMIQRLQHEYPEHRFVLSVTTGSGMKLAEKLLPDIERFYFPLDFSWAIRRALCVLQPKLIILGELELWPNLSCLASLQGIPTVVMNGRLSKKSFLGYLRFAWLTRGVFRRLSAVAAQTPEYAQRFVACGASPARVRVTGNVKFDNVELRRNAPEVEAFRELARIGSQDRIVVLGSSQREEEAALLSSFPYLQSQVPNLRLILVPRHPERFDTVTEACRELAESQSLRTSAKLRIARRSDWIHRGSPDWDILVVDTIGELRWWWGLAEVAIVGGSFGSRGGQNMLEPAAFGCNVAFGPNTSNFRDIVDLLLEGEAAERIPDIASISSWVQQQLEQPQPGIQRGKNAQTLIAQQQGATKRTLEWLAPFLQNSPQQRTCERSEAEPHNEAA